MIVVFVERLSPIANGTWSHFHYIRNGLVVISFEDQLAALQPLQGLRRKTAVFVLISVLRTKKQFVVENLEKFLCKGSNVVLIIRQKRF